MKPASVTPLIVVGVAALAAGAYSIVVLFSSSLGRYMYIEDRNLGLDDHVMREVTRMTGWDKAFLVVGLVLVAVGIATLFAALIRWHRIEQATYPV